MEEDVEEAAGEEEEDVATRKNKKLRRLQKEDMRNLLIKKSKSKHLIQVMVVVREDNTTIEEANVKEAITAGAKTRQIALRKAVVKIKLATRTVDTIINHVKVQAEDVVVEEEETVDIVETGVVVDKVRVDNNINLNNSSRRKR